jgi:hypothetical protein
MVGGVGGCRILPLCLRPDDGDVFFRSSINIFCSSLGRGTSFDLRWWR